MQTEAVEMKDGMVVDGHNDGVGCVVVSEVRFYDYGNAC